MELSTRFFWGASFGQIYPELRRLEQAGLVEPEAVLATVRRMREWREQAVRFFRAEIEPHALEDAEAGHPFPHLALQYGIAMLEGQAEWLVGVESTLADEVTGR